MTPKPKPSWRPIRPAILDDYEATLDLALRLGARLPYVNAKMLAQVPGDLKGTDYDRDSAGTSPWCETHERDVKACHKALLLCRGVPQGERSDPTGEAALGNVWDGARDIVGAIRQINHWTGVLEKLVIRWDQEDDLPDEAAERDRKNSSVWCERHRQFGFEARSKTKNGTKVPRGDGSYVLRDERKLCEWCTDTTLKLGRLPSQEQVEDHAKGKRLRVRVS